MAQYIEKMVKGQVGLIWVPHRGDRVMFKCKDRTESVHAVVTSVSMAKGCVKAKDIEYMYTVPFIACRPSNRPVETDPPSPMDKWSVYKYREVRGHDDSQPFEAQILLNNKRVIYASNDGWGGGNEYQPDYKNNVSDEVVTHLHADAKVWAVQFGDLNPFEPIDTWIYWYVHERPLGITAAKHIADNVARMAQYKQPQKEETNELNTPQS